MHFCDNFVDLVVECNLCYSLWGEPPLCFGSHFHYNLAPKAWVNMGQEMFQSSRYPKLSFQTKVEEKNYIAL